MTRFRTCVLVCALAVTAASLADDGVVGVAEELQSAEAVEVLGKNVRLDFRSAAADEDDKGLHIVTASPDYEAAVHMEGKEGEIDMKISGEVRLPADDKIFVSYNARTIIEGEEGIARFKVTGSVILKPGQELGVARMGDKTFMIKASFVEAE